MEVKGWGTYVLKVKIKLIKIRIKEWGENHAGNLKGKIEEAKKRLNELDIRSEEGELSADEIKYKREVSVKLFSLSRMKNNIMWQK